MMHLIIKATDQSRLHKSYNVRKMKEISTHKTGTGPIFAKTNSSFDCDPNIL
jgi:hypothetical protein